MKTFMSEKTRFTPVRGTEEVILSLGYNEGYVYFCTDTKKIFLDANGKDKIPMGSATSGIYYGTRAITEDDQTSSRLTFNVSFDGSESDIEGSEMPNLNDLVLNSPDGCFYRVTEILGDSSFEGTRLTVAGSGGGGASGEIVNLKLDVLSGIQTGQTYVLGQSQNIIFKGSVDNGDTKLIYQIDVTNTYASNTTSRSYGPFSADLGDNYIFDLGSVLQLGSNSVKISVTSDNAGKVVSKNFTLLNCVEMYLKEEPEDWNPLRFFKGNFNFYCTAIGANLTKTISIYVDGALLPSLTKENIILSGEEQQFTIPGQTHGTHTITAVLTCKESAASSSLTYNICCIEDGNDAPIIWYNTNTPTTIVNHDVLNIEYMVYNPLKSTNIETHYYINNTEIPTSPLEVNYSSGGWLKWRVIGYELGSNIFTLRSGTTTATIPVEILPDTKRNLDVVTAGLHVNLTAAGRSNAENAQSRETWQSKSLYDDTTVTTVKFNNFNWYNNGWITDDDGETCLRVSNGASIEIPLSVMGSRSLQESLAFEFVFKVRNVQNYSTLINTIVEDPESDNPIIRKEVSSTDGVWGSYYNNNIGFCLGTQEAFFKTKNALVSGRYKEDDLVHVTFVVEAATANNNMNKLVYIYINGLNSGITKYNVSTDSLASGCNAIKINSDYCDVDIYNIRVYRTNLTAQYVVQNYLADYNDAQLYDMNTEIVDYKNGVPSINFTKMLEYNDTHPEALLYPYMVIETTDAEDVLPYLKSNGDGWTVNIEFVNPTLDYEYEHDLWVQKDLDDRGYSSKEEMYLHSCPSYRAVGVDLNVQGTSSQGYPVRNYKAKFKNASSWIYTAGPLEGISVLKGGKTASGMKVPKKWFMDSWVGENKTTLKADYMDSSSVHNTGFASFVRTLYTKHPLDDYSSSLPAGVDSSKLRTSVYGFPIMVFHKTHDGKYEFLGRYNYNLDKGCDDSYGFCDWGDDSYINVTSLVTASNFDNTKLYVYDEEEGYVGLEADVEYDANQTYFRLDEGADSNALNPDYDPTDPYSRHYLPWSEAAECWEFSNNQGGRCSFKKADFEETYPDGKLTVVDDFEYRYHVDSDSFDNAYAGVGEAKKPKGKVFTTQEELNTWVLKKMSRYERLVKWLVSTDTTAATNEELEREKTYGTTVYTHDTAEYRLAKFTNEFNQYLDKEYCLVYYIMTELLICYDSRGKNLMMATWGPKVRGGGDIWYPIFYDIDTQLGVNNSGVPYWDYYEECSKNGTFSTPDSVLWNNLWTCFESEIKNKYDELTSNKLTIAKLDGFYRFDPEVSKSKAMCGYRPIIVHNVDEYQKYIAPSVSGYVDTQGTKGIITDTFYYCLQGSRELQRALFLRNRFNYLGSQWQAGPYSMAAAKQGIQTRFDANDYPNTSDKYLGVDPTTISDSTGTPYSERGYVYAEPETQPLDFTANYEVTPYLKQYVSYWYDDTKSTTVYASDGETVTIPMLTNKLDDIRNTPHRTQQLIYWGGPEYISSLGDLSKKYLDMFFIQSAKRLKDLRIGSDVDGYYNNMITDQSFKPDDTATVTIDGVTKSNPNAKTLLETIVLTNLQQLSGTLDFSGSEKLKELRALNTQVNSFILADGVQIAKLHLPATVTNLILKEPTSLTGILTSAAPTNETKVEFKPVGVTAASYNSSIHYINTIDGYKRCDDSEYFGYRYETVTLTEEQFDARDFDLYIYNAQDLEYVFVPTTATFNAGVQYYKRFGDLEFNETRSYYIRDEHTELVFPAGLFIQDLTDLNTITDSSKTHLGLIEIIGGNMGYDSYTLLNKAVQIKQRMITNTNLSEAYDKHLSINLEKVDWTPYRLVEAGEVAENDSVYYLLNDHGSLVAYNKVSNEYPNWTLNVLNSKVYEYIASKFTNHINDITDLSLLDTFIDDYSEAKEIYDMLDSKDNFDSNSYNFFKNTDGNVLGPTLANLTGTIYINNPASDPIDEALIKNYYNDKYYPKLNIQVANIQKANVVKFVEITDEATGQEYVWDTLKYSTTGADAREYPELTTVVGSKLNYDFRGWSSTYFTQEQLDNFEESDLANIIETPETLQALRFVDAEDRVIKLYAVYTLHSYEFTFINDDGTTIETIQVPTNELIPVPNAIPYKDDSGLDLYETYQFIGYSRIRGGSELDLIPYSADGTHLNIRASQDITFYAIFKTLDDVHENVLDTKYLEINNQGLLRVKSPYQLSGKIVLPNTMNDIQVKGIQSYGFQNQDNITHVFLEDPNNSTFTTIGERAFATDNYNLNSLIYFEMPKNVLVTIDDEAFSRCNVFFKGISEDETRTFFSRVKSFGMGAFQHIWEGFTAGIFISNNTELIKSYAFFSDYGAPKVEFGTAANPVSNSTLSFYDSASMQASQDIFTYQVPSQSHLNSVTIYTQDSENDWVYYRDNYFGFNVSGYDWSIN